MTTSVRRLHCPALAFLFTFSLSSFCSYSRTKLEKGYVDITTGTAPYIEKEEDKPYYAVLRMLEQGVPIDRICLSSDAGGSLPHFDENGNLLGMEIAGSDTLYKEITALINKGSLALEDALKPATTNPAEAYGLKEKARIKPGCHADLIFADRNLEIKHVMVRGRFLVKEGVSVDAETDA